MEEPALTLYKTIHRLYTCGGRSTVWKGFWVLTKVWVPPVILEEEEALEF